MRYLRLALLLIGACGGAPERPEPRLPSPSAPAPTSRTVEGRVRAYTTAPGGELDGVVLDDGTRVHFPPHAGGRLLPVLQRGQTIRVVGWDQRGPEGERLEARTITSIDSGETVEVVSVARPERASRQAPPRGAVPPGGTPAGAPAGLTSAQIATIEGRVVGYTTGAGGEMDGLLLDGGARVHFPSHAGAALLPIVPRGERVRVLGWEATGPEGPVIEASKVTSMTSGRAVDIAAMQVPPPRTAPPRGAVPPPEEPRPDTTAPAPTRVR